MTTPYSWSPQVGAGGLGVRARGVQRDKLADHFLVCVDRRQLPAVAPEPSVEEAPVPDLLGSILSDQSLLMMSSADVVIHRDGSLSAKRAGEHPWTAGLPYGFPRNG